MTAEAELCRKRLQRTRENNLQRNSFRRYWFVLLTVAAMMSGCVTSGPAPVPSTKPYPSPLAGPGGPTLDRPQEKSITAAWSALVSGQMSSARVQAVAAGSLAQAQLLSSQIQMEETNYEQSMTALQSLTDHHPEYAAAWVTLSQAAELAGSEKVALSAARQATELWPRSPYSDRPSDLEQRWITDRNIRARAELQDLSYEAALDDTEKVLALDPSRVDTTIVQAKALIGLVRPSEAEAVLSQLGREPEALILRARLATEQRSYQQAMDLLARLPENDSRKAGALRRSRLQWRLSILPGHVQQALESPALTRGQLAVLTLALAPELEGISGGSTPLMPDVVNLPSQRAILTVARLGVMKPDRVERRFLPNQPASKMTIENAIEVTCHLVGYRGPVWCDETAMVTSGCLRLTEPLPGREFAEMFLNLAEESGS